MHARAATIQIQPGKMQEFIDLFKETMAPVVKAQKGFQGQYLMTDASSAKALAISLWETESAMLATESSSGYIPETVAKFSSVLVGPPVFDHYELSAETSA